MGPRIGQCSYVARFALRPCFSPPGYPRGEPWRGLPWALGGLLAGALIAGLVIWKFAPPMPQELPVLSSILPSASTTSREFGFAAGPLVVSPVGKQLAFSATDQNGVTRLYAPPLASIGVVSMILAGRLFRRLYETFWIGRNITSPSVTSRMFWTNVITGSLKMLGFRDVPIEFHIENRIAEGLRILRRRKRPGAPTGPLATGPIS